MSINQKPHVHEIVICANIFVRKDDKYLMLKRSPLKKYAPGVVHPVGGKVDPNEDPFSAAQRELLEEAGVKVKNMKLEAVLTEIAPHVNEPWNWVIFHFSADYAFGDLKQTEEGELIWLTAEEILGKELFPSVRAVIKNILNPNDGIVFARLEYKDYKQINDETKIVNKCAV